ncbi:hypothetical protein BC834DRAFT_494896 [Gloeopeniophorella convolvens]|nr:hypothetical protein BC834DRAFT_494896 [Gloeopeniophorella convolvens]
MAGKKRSADEAGVEVQNGANKRKESPSGSKGAKKGTKAIPASAFKTRALPLHVNMTHTPPAIPDDDVVAAAPADPGFLGALSLQPSTFTTGSYGWKGSKRLTIELPDPEGGDGAKVQVMLTINATVIGSKQAEKEAEAEAEVQAAAADDAGDESDDGDNDDTEATEDTD